jgi:altronate dehydratase
MAEHKNAAASTEFQVAQALYAAACCDLVSSIKHNVLLAESSLEILVEAEKEPQDRKQLIVGMKCAGLISDEVAAFAIGYRWPLRAA